MDGIHLSGEWFGCPAEAPEMIQLEALRRALQPARVRERAIRRVGLDEAPVDRARSDGGA